MRVLFFIFVVLVALNAPIFVLFPLSLAYALMYPAYELIVLGAFIDAIFGLHDPVFGFVYSSTLGFTVLFSEVLKPHLSFYNEG